MHDLSECLGADIVWIEGATDPLQPLGVLLVAWISDRIEELAVSPGLLRDSKVAAPTTYHAADASRRAGRFIRIPLTR